MQILSLSLYIYICLNLSWITRPRAAELDHTTDRHNRINAAAYVCIYIYIHMCVSVSRVAESELDHTTDRHNRTNAAAYIRIYIYILVCVSRAAESELDHTTDRHIRTNALEFMHEAILYIYIIRDP